MAVRFNLPGLASFQPPSTCVYIGPKHSIAQRGSPLKVYSEAACQEMDTLNCQIDTLKKKLLTSKTKHKAHLHVLEDLVDDLTRKLEDVTKVYYGFPSTTSLQHFIESRADDVLTGKDFAAFLSRTDSLPSTNTLNMTSRSADQPPSDFCVIDNAVAAACPPPSALCSLAHVGTSSPSTITRLPTITHKASATISFNAKYLRSLRSTKGKGVSSATSASSPNSIPTSNSQALAVFNDVTGVVEDSGITPIRTTRLGLNARRALGNITNTPSRLQSTIDATQKSLTITVPADSSAIVTSTSPIGSAVAAYPAEASTQDAPTAASIVGCNAYRAETPDLKAASHPLPLVCSPIEVAGQELETPVQKSSTPAPAISQVSSPVYRYSPMDISPAPTVLDFSTNPAPSLNSVIPTSFFTTEATPLATSNALDINHPTSCTLSFTPAPFKVPLGSPFFRVEPTPTPPTILPLLAPECNAPTPPPSALPLPSAGLVGRRPLDPIRDADFLGPPIPRCTLPPFEEMQDPTHATESASDNLHGPFFFPAFLIILQYLAWGYFKVVMPVLMAIGVSSLSLFLPMITAILCLFKNLAVRFGTKFGLGLGRWWAARWGPSCSHSARFHTSPSEAVTPTQSGVMTPTQVAIYLTLSLLKYLAYNAGSLLIFFAQKISVIFGKLAMQLLFHVGSFVVDLTMELVEGCTMLSWHGVRGMPCAVITPLSHQEQQCLLQQSLLEVNTALDCWLAACVVLCHAILRKPVRVCSQASLLQHQTDLRATLTRT